MMSFLINLVSVILCIGVIIFGGYKTIEESDFESIKSEFVEAMTPVERPAPTPDDGGDTQKPDDTTGGGDTQKPDDTTGGGETQKPDDTTGGGDTQEPDGGDDSSDTSDSPIDKDAMMDIYDTYNPTTAEINKEILSNTITGNIDVNTDDGALVADVVNSYVNNLYDAIGESHDTTQAKVESGEITQEEADRIKEEFIQKESDALDAMGDLMTSFGSEEGPTDEQIDNTIDKILDSDIVYNTIKENSEAMMDDTQKSDLQNTLQGAVDSLDEEETLTEEEKRELEEKYRDFADLFGVTLN